MSLKYKDWKYFKMAAKIKMDDLVLMCRRILQYLANLQEKKVGRNGNGPIQ